MTIKSYTDIKQSKKLAEFLPLKSADMYYPIEWASPKFGVALPISTNIPCWSLAALIDIIPKRIKEDNVLRIDVGEKDTSIWYDEIGYGVYTELPNVTMECTVDACVTVIKELHKLKML